MVTVRKVKNKPDVIYGDFAPKSRWGWVATDSLIVDRYQRGLDKKFASVIAHNWDQAKAGAFKVSHRKNGQNFVIDGQTRHYALQLMANPPEFVYAEIFEGLTYEEEAELFVAQTIRRNLTSGDKFHGLMEAKDKSILEIIEAAHAAGLEADYHKGPSSKNLRAYTTLMTIHKRQGKSGLTRILKVVAQAWPDDEAAGRKPILEGLEVFYTKYPNAKDERVIKALSSTRPHIIFSDAHSMHKAFSSAVYPTIAKIIATLYNKGMRANRLPVVE